MGYEVTKSEHAGPKRGEGAYYGRKSAAKRGSKKERRRQDRGATAEAVIEREVKWTPLKSMVGPF